MKHRRTEPARILMLALAALWLPLTAPAGDLDNTVAPSVGSGMPTLGGIYTQLATGTAASVAGSFQEPGAGPTAGTGKTLADILAILPALDNTYGALSADVLPGGTFWGLNNGQWGLHTGAMPLGSNVNGSNGTLSIIVPAAYYGGSTTATASDSNLVSGNIKSGVSVFGVAGSLSGATGTATAADVLSGKTFSNGSNTGILGTMPSGSNITGSNGTLSITVPAAYYSGSTTATASDGNLVSGNIKSGVSVFGVSGAPNVVDTTTATPASAPDITVGKTAFVNGALVTGTSTLATSHVASAICVQGWGGAGCGVCAGQWSGASCNVCPTGWSGTNCDIIAKPFPTTVPTYASTPWNCVQDTGTNLTWEVKTTDGGLRDWNWTYTWYNTDLDSNGGDSGFNFVTDKCGGTLGHCDTQDYVAAVNSVRLCGYSDWRLPTHSELVGLVVGTTSPTIDTAYFPHTPPLNFWSGTPETPNYAFPVTFQDHYLSGAYFKSYPFYVRLVRGGH